MKNRIGFLMVLLISLFGGVLLNGCIKEENIATFPFSRDNYIDGLNEGSEEYGYSKIEKENVITKEISDGNLAGCTMHSYPYNKYTTLNFYESNNKLCKIRVAIDSSNASVSEVQMMSLFYSFTLGALEGESARDIGDVLVKDTTAEGENGFYELRLGENGNQDIYIFTAVPK